MGVMKSFHLGLSLIIFALALPQSPRPRKNATIIAKEAQGAVVAIVVADKDGRPLAQGSGFLISRDGLVVTNYHVIRGGRSAVIKRPDGAFFVVDGVLALDRDRDVAIIKAHGDSFHIVALGNSDQLEVGEDVVAIGSPLSLESTVSNGIVSGVRDDDGRKLLQITAPISHGSSGGPLFNLSGDVVGITSSALPGGESLNFAIPINDVKQLLRLPRQALLPFPDEDESGNNISGQDPIFINEDGATGFAEVFALEPACTGLTLLHRFPAGGHWTLTLRKLRPVDRTGRIFLSWEGLAHFTGKEGFDIDKRFDVYSLIKDDRDAETPDVCSTCVSSTSLRAGARAVCMLVKGEGGQIK
jgi:hypothetical protein